MCPILVVTGVTEMEDFTMNNKPSIKIGIVAVSRDCFPESLSVNRRKALVEAYKNKYNADEIYECPICIVESRDTYAAGIRRCQESWL